MNFRVDIFNLCDESHWGTQRIPRRQLEEEAESVLPKIKSWRDAGDTPYRKNHQEEAKP
jgi:hypothetical protein